MPNTRRSRIFSQWFDIIRYRCTRVDTISEKLWHKNAKCDFYFTTTKWTKQTSDWCVVRFYLFQFSSSNYVYVFAYICATGSVLWIIIATTKATWGGTVSNDVTIRHIIISRRFSPLMTLCTKRRWLLLRRGWVNWPKALRCTDTSSKPSRLTGHNDNRRWIADVLSPRKPHLTVQTHRWGFHRCQPPCLLWVRWLWLYVPRRWWSPSHSSPIDYVACALTVWISRVHR